MPAWVTVLVATLLGGAMGWQLHASLYAEASDDEQRMFERDE